MLSGSVCLLRINYSHYILPSGFDRVLANGLVFGEKNEFFLIHLMEQLPITVNRLNASKLYIFEFFERFSKVGSNVLHDSFAASQGSLFF